MSEHIDEDEQALDESYEAIAEAMADDLRAEIRALQDPTGHRQRHRNRELNEELQRFLTNKAALLHRLSDELATLAEQANMYAGILQVIEEGEGVGEILTTEEALERWVAKAEGEA